MDKAAALLEAARIAQIAQANAQETEAGRRLAPPVAEAIMGSPLTDAWTPAALGGDPGHPAGPMEAIETISAGDASAGWCAGITFGSSALSAVVEETAAKEFFVDRRVGLGAFAPTGRLTQAAPANALAGRWGFGSNCQQASWGALGFMRFDDAGPVMGPRGPLTGLAFLRRDQFEIEENWDMAGLRGTGSHDITADTQVEDELLSDLFNPKWPSDPLFRLRMFDVLGPCLGLVPFGIGRAALDAAKAHIEANGDQPQRGPRPPFGVDAVMQAGFARADAQLRMARAYVYDLVDEAYQHALRGDAPPREVSARLAIGLIEGLRVATAAVDVAVQIIGSAAAREGAPVERMRRDIQAAACHVLFAPAHLAPLGRQAAGMHTVVWPFLPPDS